MSGPPQFNPVRDVISGAIMAATSVPQLIAYAETTGYAGYRGLTTAGPPLAAWGVVTGHPFMNAGVTSITALMAKSDLNGDVYVAEHGEEAYVQLVAAYSLSIGIASMLLAVTGFGKLAQSVPKPVRTGFKWGCAVGVLVSALPNGLFYKGGSELKHYAGQNILIKQFITPFKSLFPGLYNVATNIFAITHPWLWSLVPTFMFIFGTYFVMDGNKKILPSFLPPGTEVILVTALAALYSVYTNYGGAIVGEIPEINPDAGIKFGPIRIPIEIMNMKKLITDTPLVQQFGNSYILLAISSLLFAAVNFLSIMGIASGFESENGIAWSAERELMSQGVSCAVAAAVGSAPVSGSMSRSLVSRMTGTTSQLACIFTALFWIYGMPLMSVMSPTPKAALSAVIVSAVLKTIVKPTDLMKLTGIDFITGWGTGILTSITSPTQGFGAGLILHYALNLINGVKQTKPKTA